MLENFPLRLYPFERNIFKTGLINGKYYSLNIYNEFIIKCCSLHCSSTLRMYRYRNLEVTHYRVHEKSLNNCWDPKYPEQNISQYMSLCIWWNDHTR